MAAKVKKGDRSKSGMRGTGKGDSKKFPAATHSQRKSALRLRGKGKGVSAEAVIRHVAAAARKAGDRAILSKIAKLRSKGKKKRKRTRK